MQALQRVHPDVPMGPGRVQGREHEYIRHGTLCLTANLEVWCGCIVSPTLGPTRNEQDFAKHIEQTVATEALVLYVAQACGITEDLGQKEKRGVLLSQASRAAFLSDKSHRIRFVYTPKHSSWLNQIEIWFSILVRKLLRRASFTSLADLRAKVLAFIDHFNRTLAKPIHWLYSPRPLKEDTPFG
jgi:hypothetical protein